MHVQATEDPHWLHLLSQPQPLHLPAQWPLSQCLGLPAVQQDEQPKAQACNGIPGTSQSEPPWKRFKGKNTLVTDSSRTHV